jgi:hypothetical protein
MSSNEYNQLLKFLYFEGYADSYAEAEELLESMSDEEFEEVFYEAKDNSYLETDMKKREENNKKAIEDMKKTDAHKSMTATVRKKFDEEVSEIEEEKKEFPTAKVERQIGKHTSKSTSSWSNKGGKSDPRKTDSYGTRSRKMSAVKSSVERGEDPRKDSVQGDQRKIFTKQFGQNVSAKTVDNEKSAYTPGGLRAHQTRAGGYRTLTRKEELEMQEAWHSGSSGYRTTASGRRVMRDEPDEAEQLRQSDMIARDPKVQAERKSAARKAVQARMKAKGTVPKKGGKPMFESIVEYLFVEGYADTIEGAEEMAENISESWVNEIIEGYRDLSRKYPEMTRRSNRLLAYKDDPVTADKIERARETHDPEKVKEKEKENKAKSVNKENYEIDEAAKDQSDKQIDQGVKKTYKAGNVLDNLHQGRSKGINKLDPRERDAKVKRMRGRLKARRDDLFQERGNREDAKRAELKKLLGL